jgi:hypothetical protein
VKEDATMNEMERLRVIIPLWLQHNEEHVEEYRRWAEGDTEASADLLDAVDAMKRVNQALDAVLEKLNGRTFHPQSY